MKVLVSGGSSGIGAAACRRIAEAALARGVQPMIAVCGHKRTTSQDEVVRSVQSMGGTAIALVGEQVIGLFDLIEREAVSDQRTEIECLCGDDTQQPSHSFLSARTECGDYRDVTESGVNSLEWHRQLARVDAEARKRPAWA